MNSGILFANQGKTPFTDVESTVVIANTFNFASNHATAIREVPMTVLLRRSIPLFFLVMLTLGFLSPTAQGSEKWFVWSNDVGWLHLGTQSDFEREKPRRLEHWGGNSNEPLVRTKVFGPFDTKKLGLERLETEVKDLEERYNRLARPKLYLVAKVGGKEYKLGEEIKLKKPPMVRLGSLYLIHLTKTFTMSGPVVKDAYIMHPAAPEGGRFKTADGSGGTFTNEGKSIGGPFKTNYELCPVLRSVGLKSITLSNKRTIDCSDPWWKTLEEQGQVASRDDSQEDEEEGSGSVTVKVLLVDDDNQLTPADQAYLRFEIKNTSTDKPIKSLWAEVRLKGDIMQAEALWITDKLKKDFFTALRNIELAPGATWDFSCEIQVATERNQWIFNNLIKNTGNDPKPSPEKQFSLASLVDLKITIPDESGSGSKVLHEGVIPVILGSETAGLMYPDLTKLAGRPLASPENLDYYTRGDKYYCHPGNTYIRALAFRAARYPYNEIGDSAMPAAGQLVAKGDPKNPGPMFPEDKDVRGIVKSVAYFVHDSLYEKLVDKSVTPSNELAQRIWKGEFGPLGPDGAKPGNFFMCQDHSFMLGSMLRALGIAVREVNVMEMLLPLPLPKVDNIQQDASSEVWHNHRWNFWGLFSSKATNDEPFRDHWKHYAGYILKYDLYVGSTRSDDSRSRFHMSRGEMDSSLLWKYIGAGARSGFYNMDVRHEVMGVAYWALSPVVAKIVLPDGRSIGASVALDPEEFRKYVFEGGKKPEGLINEIEGASYYPEGMMVYPDASDKTSAIRMKQSIVVPVKHVNELKDHKLVLKGTGDGSYEIKVSYVSPAGKAESLGSVKGMARNGETVIHSGTEFELAPITEPVAIVAATDVKETLAKVVGKETGSLASIAEPVDIVKETDVKETPAKVVGKETGSLASIAEPVDIVKKTDVKETPAKVIGEEIGREDWRVSVTLDSSKSAMTAHVEFQGKTEDTEVALAKKARTAALPDMMSFVESLPAENKNTFKDLFNKDSSLKAEVERVLKNAVFSDIGRTRKGNPSFTLWVPVSEIRMAAGLGSF